MQLACPDAPIMPLCSSIEQLRLFFSRRCCYHRCRLLRRGLLGLSSSSLPPTEHTKQTLNQHSHDDPDRNTWQVYPHSALEPLDLLLELRLGVARGLELRLEAFHLLAIRLLVVLNGAVEL
jgi:hypothetical protein